MRSIQEVGNEILSGHPKDFYIFAGKEYGVKCSYLRTLEKHYGHRVECASVDEVLNSMRTKSLIPKIPTLYIVRYDDAFVSTLSDATARHIESCKIVGTIVCLYEQPKQVSKLDKYLKDYIVSIDAVSPRFLNMYLHSDFPSMPDRLINIAEKCGANYGHARNILQSMTYADANELASMSDAEISKLFGCTPSASSDLIRQGIASRNFVYLNSLLGSYEGDADSIMYTILATMIELDSIMDRPRKESDLRPYVKRWSRQDVYYMFVATYNELKQLRSLSVSDPFNSVVFLFSLLQFPRIPNTEELL